MNKNIFYILIILLFGLGCTKKENEKKESKKSTAVLEIEKIIHRKNKNPIPSDWEKVQIGDFQITLPPKSYKLINKDSLVLSNGKDKIIIHAGWVQTWDIPYNVLDLFPDELKQKGEEEEEREEGYEDEIFPHDFHKHFIYQENKKSYIRELIFPQDLNKGLTGFLFKDTLSGNTLKFEGKNLNSKSIKIAIQVFSSIEHNPQSKIKIINYKQSDCEADGCFENKKKYDDEDEIEELFDRFSKPKLYFNGGKLKLFLTHNCCYKNHVKLIRTGYNIVVKLKSNGDNCDCICVFCYDIEVEGLENPQQYTYFYRDEQIEVLKEL